MIHHWHLGYLLPLIKSLISQKIIVLSILAAKELAHYYEVVLNKLQNVLFRPPLSTEEMEHILKVAEEMDREREEKLLEYEEDIFGEKKTLH